MENVFYFIEVWNIQLTWYSGRIRAKVCDKVHHRRCIQICIFANKRDQHHSNPFCILDNTAGHFSPFSICRNLVVYQLLCHRYLFDMKCQYLLFQEDIWPNTPVLDRSYCSLLCILGSTEDRLWLDNHHNNLCRSFAEPEHVDSSAIFEIEGKGEMLEDFVVYLFPRTSDLYIYIYNKVS